MLSSFLQVSKHLVIVKETRSAKGCAIVHRDLPLQFGKVHLRGKAQIALFDPLSRREEGTHQLLGDCGKFLALFTIGLHGLEGVL